MPMRLTAFEFVPPAKERSDTSRDPEEGALSELKGEVPEVSESLRSIYC
jgi:hypothetical protein